jgi:hypothetical protein
MIETKCLAMMGGEELVSLKVEATDRSVVLPSEATAKRYGITLKVWLQMLQSQGWVCSICGKPSKTGKYVTDHFHKRGFAKLPDIERARTVRGILDSYCNHRVLRALTLTQAQACARYLASYEQHNLEGNNALK